MPTKLPFKDHAGKTLYVGDIVMFRGKLRTIRFGEYTNGEDDFCGFFIEFFTSGVGTGRKTAFNQCVKSSP